MRMNETSCKYHVVVSSLFVVFFMLIIFGCSKDDVEISTEDMTVKYARTIAYNDSMAQVWQDYYQELGYKEEAYSYETDSSKIIGMKFPNDTHFDEAFNDARRTMGKFGLFIWNGEAYTTNIKGEPYYLPQDSVVNSTEDTVD
mgnify:CR=1 FL=1